MPRSLPPSPILAACVGASSLLAVLAPGTPAWAGPVLCTTTLEAPPGSFGQSGPVEVTRCGAVRTVPEMMRHTSYTWTSPYAPGVDLLHQVTDLFGIAMGGVNGTRVMGLGFPDQTVVWDGTAIENRANALLEEQSSPIPLRTPDLPTCYTGSLAGTTCTGAPIGPGPYEGAGSQSLGSTPYSTSWTAPVRGLW